MGLAKLYRVTGDVRYLNLAKFMLDSRGPQSTERGAGNRYVQAHQKVVDQTEAVPAVMRCARCICIRAWRTWRRLPATRATSMRSTRSGTTWLSKKLHITGGIGARAAGEAFGENYELPNMSAYNETCAAVGNDYWNHRLFLLHADAQVYRRDGADALQRPDLRRVARWQDVLL